MQTQTNIGIKFSVEGFHAFPRAKEIFGEEVAFLAERHRHKFYIVVEIKVNHDDRDQEFFLLQREVKNYINRIYGIPADFRTMSCEAIARDLFETYNAEMVYVSEDDENYAKILKTDE